MDVTKMQLPTFKPSMFGPSSSSLFQFLSALPIEITPVLSQNDKRSTPPLQKKPKLNSELTFSCLFCQENFLKPSNLITHMEKRHPNEMVHGNTNGDHSDENEEDEFDSSFLEPICELNDVEEEDEVSNEDIEEKIPFLEIPQSRGRGRRREIDEDEIEIINATGDCYFACGICDKPYKYTGDLAKHVRSSHALNNPYSCSICSKAFTHIGSLVIHHRIHSGEKPYSCKQCGKSFTQSSSLIVHQKSHLNKKKYQCEICDKGFVTSSSLIMHIKTHAEENPYQCPDCDKTFKSSALLLEHIKVHQVEFLFQCSICSEKYGQSGELVQHVGQAHIGHDRPFKCSVCEKSFTQPGSLMTHNRLHIGLKPYQCKYCEQQGIIKTFTQASSLTVHMKIHENSGVKTFKCEICQKSYSNQAYLNKHLQGHAQEYNIAASIELC